MSVLISIILAIAVFFVFFGEHLASFDETSFEKKWPAISDDEFMMRCPPGTDRNIALKVRRIVAEQLGIPYENIYPEQNFVNDLGC